MRKLPVLFMYTEATSNWTVIPNLPLYLIFLFPVNGFTIYLVTKTKSLGVISTFKKLISAAPFHLKKYLFLFVLGLHCYAQAFSNCGEWGLFFIAMHGFLIAVASLVEHGLQLLQHMGSVVVACKPWSTGSVVVLWLVESFWTRDQTSVPCIDRRILIHCTTRAVP